MPAKKFATDEERKAANAARMRLARQNQTDEQRLIEAERKRLARQNQTKEQRRKNAERMRLERQKQTEEQRLNAAAERREKRRNKTSVERNMRLAKQYMIDTRNKNANLSRQANDIQNLAEKCKEVENFLTEHFLGPMLNVFIANPAILKLKEQAEATK